MTPAKFIMSIVAAAATSSYVTFYFSQPQPSELNSVLNMENSSYFGNQNISATEQRPNLPDTKETSSTSRAECERRFGQLGHLLNDTDAKNSTKAPPTQPARIQDLQLAYEKKQNEISSFREFIERTGEKSLDIVSDNYASEPIDSVWAGSKEEELNAIFNSNEALQNSAPLELSCKSQNCRVILSAYDDDQAQSLYSAFKNEALKGNDENKNQIVSFFNDPKSSEIYIYLSKNTSRTLLDGKIE
jgi:hypothetical protein